MSTELPTALENRDVPPVRKGDVVLFEAFEDGTRVFVRAVGGTAHTLTIGDEPPIHGSYYQVMALLAPARASAYARVHGRGGKHP